MSEVKDMDATTLRRALQLVHEYTGVTIVESKKNMLQSRMRHRMQQLRLTSYNDYLDRIVADDMEGQPFIDTVTTHQTTFFRTPRIWQYFGETFLPAWTAAHARETLRVWSAAASTGEEACSIAMCCEEFSRRQTRFGYEILATDISNEVLAKAQAGHYTGASVTYFQASHPELFERYNGSGSPHCFALSEPVRKHIRFETCNLMAAPPWRDHFDLVFLRNVLIYFNPGDVKRVVRQIAPTLHDSGQLIIGESESLTGQDVPFQFIQPQVYQRRQA